MPMSKWLFNAYLDKCLDIISCMDEFVIYHVPREENPRANALAQQASSYNVRKRNFKNTKPLLKAECFALEAPVRPTQSTSLTGDNGLTVVSNLSPRAGSINDTSLTVIPDRSDRSPGKKTFAVFGEKK
jgi:hypothetical protein